MKKKKKKTTKKYVKDTKEIKSYLPKVQWVTKREFSTEQNHEHPKSK